VAFAELTAEMEQRFAQQAMNIIDELWDALKLDKDFMTNRFKVQPNNCIDKTTPPAPGTEETKIKNCNETDGTKKVYSLTYGGKTVVSATLEGQNTGESDVGVYFLDKYNKRYDVSASKKDGDVQFTVKFQGNVQFTGTKKDGDGNVQFKVTEVKT
jgi:hypothetical protein